MFGIDLDKLILVGVLVGLIVGPTRLKEWRRKLPQLVGRVHALYQQGRADVTRDLNELAPDWRDYGPRQLHPRRILAELQADMRRTAVDGDPEVNAPARPSETPVESAAEGLEQAERGPTSGRAALDLGELAAESPDEDASRHVAADGDRTGDDGPRSDVRAPHRE